MLTTRLLLAVSLLMTGWGADVPHHARAVAPCSWSYFGDPRAVAHSDRVLTGCIGTDGTALVEDFDFRTGSRRQMSLFEGLEVDDHNNPSLIFFRGRLFAFSSPHSGTSIRATGTAACATGSPSGRGRRAAASEHRARSRSGRAAGSATPTRTPSWPAGASTSSCAARAGCRTSRRRATACTGPRPARCCAAPAAGSGPTRSTRRRRTGRS